MNTSIDNKIRESLAEQEPNLLFLDGFDDAIVGLCSGIRLEHTICVAYNTNKIIKILCSEGMSEEDAWDHYHFNIEGAYVGKHTPVFISTWEGM